MAAKPNKCVLRNREISCVREWRFAGVIAAAAGRAAGSIRMVYSVDVAAEP